MNLKQWVEKNDKTKWVLAVLVGLLLLVIAMPMGEREKTKEKLASSASGQAEKNTGNSTEKSRVEAQLEKVLSSIEGAGHVQVMITYKDSGTRVVEKDAKTANEKTTETDASGGPRQVNGTNKEETTVYNSGKGDGEPFVTKELTPQIEGILVVADGGNKTAVKQNISNAILALFPVEAHKIVVVKRND